MRTHLGRLVELEYVLTHRGGRGQSFIYELLYNGEVGDSEPFLSGLIDVESLDNDYDKKNEGQKGQNEGALSVHRAANKPPPSSTKNSVKLELSTDCDDEVLTAAKKGISLKNGAASHTTCRDALVSGEDRSPNRPHNSLAAQ